jgi:DNA modification methylase
MALTERAEWHPDMPDEFKNQIVTGDARILSERIPDESIDLIFTDPIYDRIDDYRWLAETASRVLKPGGNLIMEAGQWFLPHIFQCLIDANLDYIWILSQRLCGIQGAMNSLRLTACWKPFLWYSKGKRNGGWLLDLMDDKTTIEGLRTKTNHKWGTPPNFVRQVVARLTNSNDIIFDPFTGGGTVPAVCKMLGRDYIAFEIDPVTAERARERIRNTQPPLFVLEPEQMEMGLE